MTDVVVVRAKPNQIDREDQFVAGDASIGWPHTGDLASADRTAIETALKKHYPSQALSIRVSQIYKFVNLPVGSIMLTPSYQTREIHVFRTTSTYRYRPEWEKEGNPHTIAVEHVRTVPRSAFPDQVQRALLAAKKTVTNFSKYEQLICPIVSGSWVPQDQSDHDSSTPDEVAEAVQTLRELLKSEDDQVRLHAAVALVNRGTA